MLRHPDGVTLKSVCRHSFNGIRSMTLLVYEHGRQYAMPNKLFSDITSEILSSETSDFLKQIIFLKSFYSLFETFFPYICICMYKIRPEH